MKIETIHTVHTGRTYTLEEVVVLLPNKNRKKYDRINHRDSVTIIPVDDGGNIWFVRQFRFGSNSELLELPAGVMETNEEPWNVQKEKLEKRLNGSQSVAPTRLLLSCTRYCTENNYAFLAQQLFASPLNMDEMNF
jgi:ADP-ribose pyrophosphatase